MPGLKTVKELRAEVERLTRLNARYRREAARAETLYARLALAPCETCAMRDATPPWYRRCWNWITGR